MTISMILHTMYSGKTCKKEFANFWRKCLGPNSIHPKSTQDERRQKSTWVFRDIAIYFRHYVSTKSFSFYELYTTYFLFYQNGSSLKNLSKNWLGTNLVSVFLVVCSSWGLNFGPFLGSYKSFSFTFVRFFKTSHQVQILFFIPTLDKS